MAEVPSGAPGSPSTTNPPAQASQATQDPPQYATKAELQEILQRLDGISGKVGGLANDFKSLKSAPAAKPDDPEVVTMKSLQRELAEERANRAKDKAEFNRTKAYATYRDELVKGGVNPLQAADLADRWADKNSEKIKMGVDGSAHLDDGAGMQPVQKLVADWLKTSHGMTYLPPKQGPGSPPGLNGGGEDTKGGAHPFASKSYKEIMDSPRADLRSSYMRDHREEFDRKKDAHRAGT